MKPSIGRIIHVQRHGYVAPAIVTRVHTDSCVNATVFELDGSTSVVTSCSLGTLPGTWCWPPREQPITLPGVMPPAHFGGSVTETVTVDTVVATPDAPTPNNAGPQS